MTELLTSAQMRTIEQAAIASGKVTGLELMERAGQGVVEAVFEEWPELAQSSHKAVVLCGPGNNGGDGFVIARLLRQRGWAVEVFLYGDPEKLPPDAKVNYERWVAGGGHVHRDWETIYKAEQALRLHMLGASITVDALFGTGLTRPLGTLHNELWHAFDLDTGPIYRLVSVDLPSGLCGDSGRLLGMEEFAAQSEAKGMAPSALAATLTVTFHCRKVGHVLAQGPIMCGKVVTKDIGLSSGPKLPSVVTIFPKGGVFDVQAPFTGWIAKGTGHKYTHGHALILSGLSGKTGAARLAARAALRVGAGLVTLGTPHEAVTEVSAQITAIMLAEIDTPEILTRVLSDKRLNGLCIGPGFGVERAGEFLPHVLAAKCATVLDADALAALAESETGFADLHENCVLTPHAGEFKRLFPDIAAKLAEPPTKGPAYSKVDATREAAKRAGCTVLFKGPDTVIASPNGRCSINAAVYERAAPWLATAGSGDVLAGLITGLMARGFAPHHAAETSAWLHVEAARSFGPGLIAEDLPEELPKVFRALGA
jgi:yjeF C-terminal region, hydroxyethylthiazole kinase-related/yjeF N-terminal region